jgi:hypothetical protein
MASRRVNPIRPRLTFTIATGLLVLGLLAAYRYSASEPYAPGLIKDYRTWVRVNPVPFRMNYVSASSCTGISRPPRGAADPHIDKYVTVYVNEVGKNAMLHKKYPDFPIGTVIVKEKLPSREGGAPELLTAMRKREQDYNPSAGDWEYLVYDGAGTNVEDHGRLETCVACHGMYRRTDFVTRHYVPQDVVAKMK